jgi:hypothetical protein
VAPSQRIGGAHVDIEGREADLLKAFERIQKNLDELAAHQERTSKKFADSADQASAAQNRLNSRIDETRRIITRLNAQGEIKPRVAKKALQDLETLQSKVNDLNESDINIATSTVGSANEDLTKLEVKIKDLNGKNVAIEANAETLKAHAALRSLNHEVNKLDGKTIKINTKRFQADINASNGLVKALKLGLGAITAGGFIAWLLRTKGPMVGFMNNLGKAKVNSKAMGLSMIPVVLGLARMNPALAKLIPNLKSFIPSIGKVSGVMRIFNMQVILAVVKIPAMIAAVGALVPAVFDLGGGLVALIAPLQSIVGEAGALIGAFGAMTPMIVAGGAGFVSLLSAVLPTVTALKTIVKPAQQAAMAIAASEKITSGPARATALRSAAQQYGALTETQKKFVPVQADAIREFQKFQDLLADPALKTYKNLLDIAIGTMQNLRGELKSNADEVARFSGKLKDLIGSDRFQAFFKDLMTAGGDILITLEGPLLNALDGVRAVLQASLPFALKLAEGLGHILDKFGDWATMAEKSGRLTEIFQTAYYLSSQLWKSISNLIQALQIFFGGGIVEGSGILDDLIKITAAFDDFMKRVRDNGDLTTFFATAHREFNLVISTLWEIGKTLVGIFKAALPAGEELFGTIRNWFRDLNSQIFSVSGQRGLRDFFESTLAPLQLMGHLLVILGKALFSIYQNVGPQFEVLIRRLGEEVIPVWATAISNTANALSGPLVDALVELGKALAVLLTSSGPIQVFISTLAKMISLFNALPTPVKNFITAAVALKVIGSALGLNVIPAIIHTGTRITATVFLVRTLRREFERMAARATEAFAQTTAAAELANARIARTVPGASASNPVVTAAQYSAPIGPARGPAGAGREAAAAEKQSLRLRDVILGLGNLLLSFPSKIKGGLGGLVKAFKDPIGAGKILAKILGTLFSRAVITAAVRFTKVAGVVGIIITVLMGVVDALKENFLGLRDAFEHVASNFRRIGKRLDKLFHDVFGKGAGDSIKIFIHYLMLAIKWVGIIAGAAVLGILIGVLEVVSYTIEGVVIGIQALVDAFQAVGDAVGWAIDKINDLKNLLPQVKVPGWLDKALTFSPVGLFTKGKNQGGYVPGQGRGDKVKALLEPGEFVIRRDAVKEIGLNVLHHLNSGGKKVRTAIGGRFQTRREPGPDRCWRPEPLPLRRNVRQGHQRHPRRTPRQVQDRLRGVPKHGRDGDQEGRRPPQAADGHDGQRGHREVAKDEGCRLRACTEDVREHLQRVREDPEIRQAPLRQDQGQGRLQHQDHP